MLSISASTVHTALATPTSTPRSLIALSFGSSDQLLNSPLTSCYLNHHFANIFHFTQFSSLLFSSLQTLWTEDSISPFPLRSAFITGITVPVRQLTVLIRSTGIFIRLQCVEYVVVSILLRFENLCRCCILLTNV
ncbi:hypothetical protein VNO78_02111 [Psophocarpus tetragonolobus]|uniref:Uncharacterized protein n=1 Tax=Psophocarpus tetragonolobus TaxID=3891 RepID=A0AAN9SZN9_PSOTE